MFKSWLSVLFFGVIIFHLLFINYSENGLLLRRVLLVLEVTTQHSCGYKFQLIED